MAHKGGKRVHLLPEALCTGIPLFPVSEREEQEGRKRERQKINSGIKWQQTDHAGAEVPLNLHRAEVSFFFFSPVLALFPLFFFYPLPPAPLSPEISFQHSKPCKNRPRVFKLRPVCKDVPACYAASGYCCSGPLVSFCLRCFCSVQSWPMKSPTWWEQDEKVASRCYCFRLITFSRQQSIL